jgi:uncharacterized protein (TIGR03435 family)
VGVPPGRLHVTCMPIMTLIQLAYISYASDVLRPLESVPISGGPTWLKNDPYNVEAKAEGNPSSKAKQGPMLQALLEDRLRLKIHREMKEIPVYELTLRRAA